MRTSYNSKFSIFLREILLVPKMKTYLLLFTISFITCSCATSLKLSSESRKTKTAFTNVTIVDVDKGENIPHQSVIIQDGYIVEIGLTSNTELDENTRVIDATGKYLIPGLWDMHVHLEFSENDVLPIFVANGVTGVRDMGTNSFDTLSDWRTKVKKGELVGPQIITSGPMIDGPFFTDELRITVQTEQEAREAVDSLISIGVDFIKVHQQISKEAYLAVADQAQEHNIPIVGHHPASVNTKELIEAGQKSIEHIFGVPGPDSGLYHVMEDKGVSVTPNLVIIDKIAKYDELAAINDTREKYISPKLLEFWDEQTEAWGENVESTIMTMKNLLPVMFERTSSLEEAGINLLAGTDFGVVNIYPGSSLHEELKLLVDAGLKPYEALQTATINPAKFLNQEERLGTVDIGKEADLVLLNSNPLEDISNTQDIFMVIVNGKIISQHE